MTDQLSSLVQMRKASKFARRVLREKGPKSFFSGQGALLRALADQGEMKQRDLVKVLGYNRHDLKDIVKKAARNEFVELCSSDEKKTYTVKLTELGQQVVDKRMAVEAELAKELLADVTEEELAALDVVTAKIIAAAEGTGVDLSRPKRKKLVSKDECEASEEGHQHGHGRGRAEDGCEGEEHEGGEEHKHQHGKKRGEGRDSRGAGKGMGHGKGQGRGKGQGAGRQGGCSGE